MCVSYIYRSVHISVNIYNIYMHIYVYCPMDSISIHTIHIYIYIYIYCPLDGIQFVSTYGTVYIYIYLFIYCPIYSCTCIYILYTIIYIYMYRPMDIHCCHDITSQTPAIKGSPLRLRLTSATHAENRRPGLTGSTVPVRSGFTGVH